MESGDLPSHLRPVMQALTAVVRRRAPAIRERVERLHAENPTLGPDALARRLIATTRRRGAPPGAGPGAPPGAPRGGPPVPLGARPGAGPGPPPGGTPPGPGARR